MIVYFLFAVRPPSVGQIAPPECGIFLVVADLNGSKDTVKMLACLNECFPHAKVRGEPGRVGGICSASSSSSSSPSSSEGGTPSDSGLEGKCSARRRREHTLPSSARALPRRDRVC